MLEIWNKVDLLHEEPPEGICISCVTGEGLAELAKLIEEKLTKIKGMSLRQI